MPPIKMRFGQKLMVALLLYLTFCATLEISRGRVLEYLPIATLAFGGLCNLAVIHANRGRMPVRATSPRTRKQIQHSRIHCRETRRTRLHWLGDVIPLGGGTIHASIGDILMLAGFAGSTGKLFADQNSSLTVLIGALGTCGLTGICLLFLFNRHLLCWYAARKRRMRQGRWCIAHPPEGKVWLPPSHRTNNSARTS